MALSYIFIFLNFESTALGVEGCGRCYRPALSQATEMGKQLPKLPLSWPITTEVHCPLFCSGQRYPEAIVLREV